MPSQRRAELVEHTLRETVSGLGLISSPSRRSVRALAADGASISHPSTAGIESGAVDGAPARQRAKLWDLNSSVHCSIIGTCLTTAELRRIMGKIAKQPILHLSDHDLHAEAVGLCDKHNVYSKLIHKALDQRHQAVINQFGRIMGEPADLG